LTTVERQAQPIRIGDLAGNEAILASTGSRPVNRLRPDPMRAPRAGNWLLIAAIVLAALNLRTAVTSVGPLLDELEQGIGLSSGLAGVLTTMPVISFAALGWITPRLAARFGSHRTLTGALSMMTAGLVLRAGAGSPWLFLAATVPALAGGAMGNVLLPVIVKQHFPRRVGAMTATYTTALAVGTTLAAAAAVPIASIRGKPDWRLGLGAWAALSGLAVLTWLFVAHRTASAASPRPVAHGSHLLRSPTAWALTLFFGAQSMQAYIAFGWFAQFYREQASFSAAQGGVLVAFLAGVSVPVSVAVPYVAARMRSQRGLIGAFVACYVVAYAGMLADPGAGAWLWALLAGLGAGAFPLALTLIGLRSRTPEGTAALSAFSQSIGYILAGLGPLLVGVLHGATGGWGAPFALMFADLGVLAGAGWYIGKPRYVEDDLGREGTGP